MINSAFLDDLPEPAKLEQLTQALAVLDAIMSPEWWYRYYSFDATWALGERMASMRNGSGDHWNMVFSDAGAALVGLAHESSTFEPGNPKPWVFDGFPEVFEKNLRLEPAFETENSTFCIWHLIEEGQWKSGVEGPVDDGSAELLNILNGDPKTYVKFAEDYYEAELALKDVAHVYAHKPLTETLVKRMNPDVEFSSFWEEIHSILGTK
ncbi:hypothetical protein FRD01_22180 [Microvenator marinus]|uniref:Uncharacterized protein n=1 Tax=Microvenator marinus TaxID=2600177 RepID=A0A5B8XVE7_9DELT|nr:hypothetical protein [Microvenator marinus]QED29892.1 hypothetical protein FRD01_22180 [Microvenator marinus]